MGKGTEGGYNVKYQTNALEGLHAFVKLHHLNSLNVRVFYVVINIAAESLISVTHIFRQAGMSFHGFAPMLQQAFL